MANTSPIFCRLRQARLTHLPYEPGIPKATPDAFWARVMGNSSGDGGNPEEESIVNLLLTKDTATRWILTITTVKSQYTFKTLVMDYKNSSAYVQRQMDIILEPVDNADAYYNDICITSLTSEERVHDLIHVLMLIRSKNMSISPRPGY
ncbi:uncharacterized protein F4812DRAFT_27846 [Daldinia caldariorum]|uniref:uncharacterized protein n=1 Tax=Daldinia caldariorum TaxID=326644 RepID=UPI00200861B5|nr:uncharacterized protein F4812DRAFT_27846 [Daldinia caldariorum]KAI1472824.1 hypothetical protein F4812DRAFT_27846 [Daldinia caldariorum]